MERSRTLEARHAAEAERERAAAIALETEEAQLEVLRQSLYEHEAALEAARTRLSELTLAVDRHQARSGYCKQQIAETDVRAQETAREEQELVARVAPLGETLAARRGEESRLRDELQAAEAELDGRRGRGRRGRRAACSAAETGQEREPRGAGGAAWPDGDALRTRRPPCRATPSAPRPTSPSWRRERASSSASERTRVGARGGAREGPRGRGARRRADGRA